MSILIKGMEMPTEDEEIIIRISSDGMVMTEYALPITGVKAVSVPPHGRLGDLDALYESCALDTNIDVMASAKRINEYMQLKIDEAPTIIPAEQKGE